MKNEAERGAPDEESSEKGRRRRLPPADIPGIADARVLPDAEFAAAWKSILLPADAKARLARQAVANSTSCLPQPPPVMLRSVP